MTNSGIASKALSLSFAVFLFSASAALPAEERPLSGTLELPRTTGAPVEWGRDPFVPLVKKVAAPDTVLKAVIYNPENPSAIINGHIVYVGSEIGGQKVIDIGRTHVILQGEYGRVRLEISETPERADALKEK